MIYTNQPFQGFPGLLCCPLPGPGSTPGVNAGGGKANCRLSGQTPGKGGQAAGEKSEAERGPEQGSP